MCGSAGRRGPGASGPYSSAPASIKAPRSPRQPGLSRLSGWGGRFRGIPTFKDSGNLAIVPAPGQGGSSWRLSVLGGRLVLGAGRWVPCLQPPSRSFSLCFVGWRGGGLFVFLMPRTQLCPLSATVVWKGTSLGFGRTRMSSRLPLIICFERGQSISFV